MRFVLSFVFTILATCGALPAAPAVPDYYGEILEARTMFNSEILPFLDHSNNDGKNVLVSLYGLHSALSAALAGAEGKTYKQLWNALG